MPIYEYQCHQCGQHLELLQKMSDAPATQCPHCKKPTLEKLVSSAGFQLKGNGWYATDFRQKNSPTKNNNAETTSSSASTDTKITSSDTDKGSTSSK